MYDFPLDEDKVKELLEGKNFRRIIKKAFPQASGIRFLSDKYYARFSLPSGRFHISIDIFSGFGSSQSVWETLRSGHVLWSKEDEDSEVIKDKLRSAFKEVTGMPYDRPDPMEIGKLKEVIKTTFSSASGFRSVWNEGNLRFNLDSRRFQVGAYVAHDGKVEFYVNEVRNSYRLNTENEQTEWVKRKLKEKANRS